MLTVDAVSYTHLDVYKRQIQYNTIQYNTIRLYIILMQKLFVGVSESQEVDFFIVSIAHIKL